MYKLTLDDSSKIHVNYKNTTINYALDGSLPNPLEATYAALAGCAGVYSRKACKELQISADGIKIHCKPVVSTINTLIPTRFITEVLFPERITLQQRQKILEEISHCAVKELIHGGSMIDFTTREIKTA